MSRAALLLVGALLSAAFAGCGQKGALYLPEKNGTAVSMPAVSAPATSAPAGAPENSPQNPAQGTPKKTDGNDDSPPPPQ
jgi:predicted small lipoprotein YifL